MKDLVVKRLRQHICVHLCRGERVTRTSPWRGIVRASCSSGARCAWNDGRPSCAAQGCTRHCCPRPPRWDRARYRRRRGAGCVLPDRGSRSQMASARKLGAGENWELGVYWSFGFEGFNKVMKQGAQTSNWRCTALAVMKYWSMRSARVLDKCV